MLYLVGTGISEKGIAMDALEACKSSDTLYVDRYTSRISDEKIAFLQAETKKRIIPIGRSELEERSDRMINEAATNDVAILVGGDPLIATTHKILFINAKKRGIPVKIFHSGSILDAIIGESGLDFYRFGPIATIPRWSEHYKPVSFYETMAENYKRNLHSILLLDYSIADASSIPVSEAIHTLIEAESHYKEKLVSDSTKIIVLSDLGQKAERHRFITIKEAYALPVGIGQSVIIMPANLSEIEAEITKSIYE